MKIVVIRKYIDDFVVLNFGTNGTPYSHVFNDPASQGSLGHDLVAI